MDRQEAIMRIVEHMHIHKIGQYPHIHIKEALVMAIAALQEEPVKHGRWERDEWGSHLKRCSVCKKSPVFKDEYSSQTAVCYTAICPNCGAKMEMF